jgi:hypothetical protein
VQFPSHIIHAFIVAQYALRNCMAYFTNEPFHIEILEDTANDRMGKEISCGKREH